MQPPPSMQPNYAYDDPGMGRYLDDSFRWNAGLNQNILVLFMTSEV